MPAIIEYLPYRERDGATARDESTYAAFASAGYAGVRVDRAGHGESDGTFDDEYPGAELADGVEVIGRRTNRWEPAACLSGTFTERRPPLGRAKPANTVHELPYRHRYRRLRTTRSWFDLG